MKLPTEKQITQRAKIHFQKYLKEKKIPTKNSICIEFDIVKETYRQWIKKSAALKKVEILIEEIWTQALREHNVAGVIFYLKNAFGWRDSKDLEVNMRPLIIKFHSSFNKNDNSSPRTVKNKSK